MTAAFQLLRPYWLLSLLPALLLWWWLWRGSDPRQAWSRHIAPHLLPHLLVEGEQGSRLRPIHLLGIVWMLMIIALAGPAWRPMPSPFAEDDAAVMVVLKVTPSMTATDVAPTRLDRSLQKLRDFLVARAGAPTGLIVYSGTSHLVMPPTRDTDILTFMTEGLSPDMMPEQGDALADALKRAETIMQRADQPGSVVLLADGVSDHQLDLLSKDGSAKAPVHTLAMHPAGKSEPSLKKLSAVRSGSLESLTVDEKDVELLARRAAGSLSGVAGEPGGRQMKDEGYLLVPFIALGFLMWSRKGWVVR